MDVNPVNSGADFFFFLGGGGGGGGGFLYETTFFFFFFELSTNQFWPIQTSSFPRPNVSVWLYICM